MNRETTSDAIAEVVQFDLDNGLHVILQEDHSAPVVAFQMWVKTGSADESPEEAGLAHVLEHMLFKGTGRRGVGEIARDIEGAGGDVNAWTSHDETVFHLALPSSEMDQGADILSDAVANSALDSEELARELEVIREEIKRGKDVPQRRLSEATFSLSFTKHPYRNPIIGSDESVASFDRERVYGFYRKWYSPTNMALVVTGDFDTERAKRMVASHFRTLERRSEIAHRKLVEPKQTKPRVAVVPDDSKQVHLALTFPAGAIDDEDVPALDALSVILGQGESSRLVRLLRRKLSLVNDIATYVYSGRSAGLFMIEADVPAEKLQDTLQQLGRELFGIGNETIGSRELTKAQTILENEAVFSAQTMQGRGRRLGLGHTLTGDAMFSEKYMEKIRNLSPEKLVKAAEDCLDRSKINLALLWPKDAGEAPDGQSLIDLLCEPIDTTLEKKYEADEKGIYRYVLENGIRVIVKPVDSMDVVSIQAGWLAGLRHETEANNGINNLIARMLTLGTRRRDAIDMAEAIDSIGMLMSGFSGRNTLGLKASVNHRFFDRGFDLFSECLLEPGFSAIEMDREKILVKEEIRNRDDNPARLAFDLFHRTLYTSHPFRMDPLGSNESVDSLDQDDLAAYYYSVFAPERLVLSVVGKVTFEDAIEKIRERFEALEKLSEPPADPAIEEAAKDIRKSSVILDRQQSNIVIGFNGLIFKDPDRFPLMVLNAVLSGQGGRLFMELRDRQSLAYSVASFHLESLDPGYFAVYIGTSPDKFEAANNGILSELKQVLEGGITEEEIEHAKRYLCGSFDIGLQTSSSQAGQILLDEIYDLGYDAYTTYADKIRAVSPDDVQRVAHRLLQLDRYCMAVVGPDMD